MSSVEVSEPSIIDAHPAVVVKAGGHCFVIKKSAVIGLSVGDEYLLIYIKHFEGNFIKLPLNPRNRDTLIRDATKYCF